MGRIRQLFGRYLNRRKGKEDLGTEELRTVFKARYHQFKLLLNANNKALEVMTEMEEAVKGTSPFGMKFVRSRCTSVSASVFQIVKHLNELAPGKYERLYERFKEIQKEINPYLRIDPGHSAKSSVYALPLKEINRNLADQVGAKMANLGEIKNVVRMPVPNGFVITAGAYQRFMEENDLQPEIDRLIQAAEVERPDQLYRLSTAIQQRIIGASIPEDVKASVSERYRALEAEEGKGVKVILRSSALGEDLPGASFAGQYRSELNVSGENLFQAYKEVVASKYGVAAMTYRFNRGIPDEEIAMCVGCLAMVDALSGGVVYTRNPVDLREHAVLINAVWGLPKPVVDGSVTADLFVVSRDRPMKISCREIAVKGQKFVCYPEEGICRLDALTEESERPSLTDEKALELAELSVRLEAHYGRPQDMEWAVSNDGSIVILQCRPLEQMERPERAQEREGKELEAPIVRGGARASPGAASGPAFFVKKDVDALRFPKGAVLIAEQSLPRWATLLNRASAVVTEQGSLSGHLANVAREFGVPALFGVKGALALVQPGQVVTVDADGLSIYEGLIEELLQRDEPRNLMAGSPVFEALSGAARFITPLNLLDPDAPAFRPENCETLHDITRFCHEKAVDEMFRFGKDHRFPERSSKQLLGDAPMQWWVLNLDDGFKEEVEGRYVRLENIESIPMLALWKGITAVPWEGPPPVDGKGLMSVMFEATQNRALVPGMRSQYADRNYFMISKHYCSLSSRLGFHFSTVETLVSERASENYISFQYKGGAADSFRKIKRVLFIQEILEDHGFRAEVREDALIARIEGREQTVMERDLRILGYLTMHTRQLDMIMSNDAALNYYRTKIEKDIREVVCSK